MEHVQSINKPWKIPPLPPNGCRTLPALSITQHLHRLRYGWVTDTVRPHVVKPWRYRHRNHTCIQRPVECNCAKTTKRPRSSLPWGIAKTGRGALKLANVKTCANVYPHRALLAASQPIRIPHSIATTQYNPGSGGNVYVCPFWLAGAKHL